MKIALVIDLIDSPSNGSVITARRFAEGLRADGNEVRIVAIGADGPDDCPVDERYIPLVTEVSARNNIRFGKFNEGKVRKAFEGVDIVHILFPFKFDTQCKKLADRMGIPTTAAFHVQPENISYNMHLEKLGIFNRALYARYRRSFYRKFNRIHCPSAFTAEQLEAHKYKSELYVISNGYDPDFVPPEHRPVNDRFEIVMVGRLSNEKNQKVLVSAIGRSKYRDRIHLSLYGKGPYRDRLERQARKLGVDISFDFLPKEELIKRLGAADLYVHTGAVENESIACLEAIACGLVPVISDSRASATKQFALDSRSVFSASDPASLASKIDYWYEHDDERKTMGGVYANYAKKYTLDNSIVMAEKMFRDEIDSFGRKKNDVRAPKAKAVIYNEYRSDIVMPGGQDDEDEELVASVAGDN